MDVHARDENVVLMEAVDAAAADVIAAESASLMQ